MPSITDLSKKYLASPKLGSQIWGATLKRWRLLVLLILCLLPLVIPCAAQAITNPWYRLLELTCLTVFAILTISVCQTLTNIFNLVKKEVGITWCQIFIFVAIGIWIVGFIFIFHIQKEQKSIVAIGVIGSLLTWIFQDKVKGVVAFIHLRMHHLLNIGDWIKVPKYDVDGEVKRVTLTTVTVYNWDTTTSTIPISALYSEHFMNLQNMMVGKTYGRQMLKTFVLDTSWFRLVSKEELKGIKEKIKANEGSMDEKYRDFIKQNLSSDEIQEGVLNAQLFRLYTFHWLMNHPHISQQPRLIVRWMEQEGNGMPLQIYVFITDSNLQAFEWQQSQIIEHIIESLDWFGLRLFQSPSAYDASNNNIYLASQPANYIKEIRHE